MFYRLYAFGILLIFQIFFTAQFNCITLKLNNIRCITYDKPFAEFKTCSLKVLQRGKIAINFHLVLHKVPVRSIMINYDIMRKSNGYHPYLVNYTADYCKFVKYRERYLPLQALFDLVLKDGNFNHSCPYDHDIILKDCTISTDWYRIMPVPTGDYRFDVRLGTDNNWKVELQVFMNVEI